MPLFRIISDQIMEAKVINLTAWYLAQKLACLEDIQGDKLTLSVHPRKVPDKRFLQWLKKNTTQ